MNDYSTIVNVGDRFSKLVVIEIIRKQYQKRLRTFCICKCDCGNITKETIKSNLYRGISRSCGCLKALESRERAFTHGMTGTTELWTWNSMIRRCTNPQTEEDAALYKNKGILVCERWLLSFNNFLADMGHKPSKKHSLDRIDSSGNYEPSNCRWATPKEQARNTSKNVIVEYNGKSMCLAELSESSSVSYRLLHARIFRLKWDISRAVETPPNKRLGKRRVT